MSGTQRETKEVRPILLLGIGLSLLTLIGVFLLRTEWPRLERSRSSVTTPNKADGRATRASAYESDSAETLRFLLLRAKRDPDDFLIQTMLASAMLQKVRETGNADYLERAKQAADSSLRSVPAERNGGGLSARARVEMAEHDFVKAKEDGLRLTQLHPTLNSWGVLTDALLELGDYAKADAAIQEMRKLGSDTAETEIRLGRLLFLQGDTEGAQKHLFRALAFARNMPAPPRETVAWCRWQLGEMAFSKGDYRSAESYYREAVETYPGYVQALASLGRVRAAQGDLQSAIPPYEQAVRRFPDPTFVAALGDLYHLAGREADAQTQYALVEQIARLSALNGTRYNRQISTFYADHDRHAAEAYTDAQREYQVRRDIYGADALAWSALKAGRLAEAEKTISAALRLSTRDAKLYYHAGMIAAAGSHPDSSREYLRRALALNPGFDPLQAITARKTLAQ